MGYEIIYKKDEKVWSDRANKNRVMHGVMVGIVMIGLALLNFTYFVPPVAFIFWIIESLLYAIFSTGLEIRNTLNRMEYKMEGKRSERPRK